MTIFAILLIAVLVYTFRPRKRPEMMIVSHASLDAYYRTIGRNG